MQKKSHYTGLGQKAISQLDKGDTSLENKYQALHSALMYYLENRMQQKDKDLDQHTRNENIAKLNYTFNPSFKILGLEEYQITSIKGGVNGKLNIGIKATTGQQINIPIQITENNFYMQMNQVLGLDLASRNWACNHELLSSYILVNLLVELQAREVIQDPTDICNKDLWHRMAIQCFEQINIRDKFAVKKDEGNVLPVNVNKIYQELALKNQSITQLQQENQQLQIQVQQLQAQLNDMQQQMLQMQQMNNGQPRLSREEIKKRRKKNGCCGGLF